MTTVVSGILKHKAPGLLISAFIVISSMADVKRTQNQTKFSCFASDSLLILFNILFAALQLRDVVTQPDAGGKGNLNIFCVCRKSGEAIINIDRFFSVRAGGLRSVTSTGRRERERVVDVFSSNLVDVCIKSF